MPDTIMSKAPTTDWIGLADRIGQVISEAASRHDREESFVREGFEALRAAGFFRALVPAELGGGGADYREMCGAIQRLGHHCGATALAFSMHCHLVAVPAWRWRHEKAPVEGLLKRVAQEDLILISSGGSDWLPGSGKAVKVEGGYRIHGRKIFASGCPMGDLLMTSAIHDDPEKGPEVLHFPVSFKAEGVRLLDTWHVMGMRGTGSQDVELDGVFVPDAAIAARREPGKWHMLFHHIFAMAFPLVYAAYVGVAEGARAKALTIARLKGEPAKLAAAAGKLENAFAKAEMALDRMITIAETEAPGPARTGRAATARTLTGQAAIETVERAMELVGGASFYRDLGLERAFRDVQGARFHPLQEMPQLEMTGRLALGLPIDG
ncbi:acyl-CoA dehydrogenase [Roseococcus sp. SYP-B2431]|uniref:acyl-CoA dehydrogenase family protein n=1 Tax=Roseococcus sp. SYP-B2431 TaxID=2496640 RepID=UPI0010394B7B|nr:acyl-CoA dehydrogenase family protein [Roseococcus sp. SYP-B2431]TCH99097.1 acyl-CoA dehydrogenase [Roseococcus sp. SYP-B2431]